jgi:hypothetical protein
MATTETFSGPALGEHGDPCAFCNAPLAFDQRYCLNCGERRGQARLPFMEILREPASPPPDDPPSAPPEAPAPEPSPKWMAPLLASAAVAALAIMLAVGVMIGDDGDGKATAQAPIVVGGNAGATGGAGGAAAGFKSDWPDGQNGWTVQLTTLPVEGTTATQVAAAKTDAEGKGASEVGALLSDDFGVEPASTYIVYSGQFSTQKQATAALKALKADFPDAKVLEIGTGGGGSDGDKEKEDPDALSGKKPKATVSRNQLNDLQNTSPEDYSKKSGKLPDQTVIPGTPPPKDNKPAGGGSGSQTIE